MCCIETETETTGQAGSGVPGAVAEAHSSVGSRAGKCRALQAGAQRGREKARQKIAENICIGSAL